MRQTGIKLDSCEPNCTLLRKQSFSSPAVLLIESCQVKLEKLQERVTRSTTQAREQRSQLTIPSFPLNKERNHSVADLRTASLAKMSEQAPPKGLRTCHQCHAPQSDPSHAGIPTGAGHCSLQHWEHCQLNKVEDYDDRKKYWTGCPVPSFCDRE